MVKIKKNWNLIYKILERKKWKISRSLTKPSCTKSGGKINSSENRAKHNRSGILLVKSQGQGHRHGRKHTLTSQEKSAGSNMFPETRQYFRTKGKQQHYQWSKPMVCPFQVPMVRGKWWNAIYLTQANCLVTISCVEGCHPDTIFGQSSGRVPRLWFCWVRLSHWSICLANDRLSFDPEGTLVSPV